MLPRFYHAKNWRPQILVLCRCDRRFNPVKPELLAVAGHLKKGQGLLMAHALIDAGDRGARALVAEAATEVLRLHLQDRAIQGFPRAIVYRANAELPTQTEDALLGTAQSCGVGAMRPNSVLLGWPSKYRGDEVKKGRHGFVRLLRDLSAMRKALIVVKDGASLAGREPFDATRTVDVWWVAVWKSNLQPDFNLSVFECFDTSSSAGLRELDESDRSVQKSAESTSI